MLAYLFWHRPRPGVEREDYEAAQRSFHAGIDVPSAVFRVAELPFEAGAGYEDWYLVEDWRALGELNAAAVDSAHRGAHDRAASMAGPGWGAVYALLRGPGSVPEEARWMDKPRGEPVERFLAPLGEEAPIWRRQMLLGPAPELCLGAGGAPRTRVWPAS